MSENSLRSFVELLARLVSHPDSPCRFLVALTDQGLLEFLVAGDPPTASHAGTQPDARSPAGSPIDALIGLRAPGHWRALAISADATTRRQRVPVRLVAAADTTGSVASRLLALDPAPTEPLDGAGHEPDGLLPALLRCALGAPNPPPPISPATIWNARWVQTLVETALEHRFTDYREWRPEFRDLARHHPVCRSPAPNDPTVLVRAIANAEAVYDWGHLHRLACVHPNGGLGVDRELAQWCDASTFALLAERLAPPDSLIVDLGELLAPASVLAVAITLSESTDDAPADDAPPDE